MTLMYGHYSKFDSGFWEDFFSRRENELRDRKRRDNVVDFIEVLAHYLPQRAVAQKVLASKVLEHFCNTDSSKPCGHAVRISINVLPGKLNKKSNYDIRK